MTINEKIRAALKADKRSNRWLIEELKDSGILLNDVQMSNRLNGITDFSFDEAAACIKALKIPTNSYLSA